MSSASVTKKHAVSSASAEAAGSGTKLGGADDGPSTKHKRMRLEDDDRKPSADPHGDLTLALKRKEKALVKVGLARWRLRAGRNQLEDFSGAFAEMQAAKRRLKKCVVVEEAARQDIRARGEAEFDSLLVVGLDSVSHILDYCDAKQLCRCERICKAFQRLSGEVWKGLDKRSGPHKSINADSLKKKCVWYARASEYAQKIDHLARNHRWSGYRCHHYRYRSREGDGGYCELLKQHDWPSDFKRRHHCRIPDELTSVDASEIELFLRICANHSGEVLIEGFFPLRFFNESPCLDLCSAHCPNWPEMESLLSLQQNEQEDQKKKWDEQAECVHSTLKDYSATFTLVSFTETNKPRLIALIDEFVPFHPDVTEEDDPWVSTVSGEISLTPHRFHDNRRVETLAVEFGWCKKREVVGFCLVETTQIF